MHRWLSDYADIHTKAWVWWVSLKKKKAAPRAALLSFACSNSLVLDLLKPKWSLWNPRWRGRCGGRQVHSVLTLLENKNTSDRTLSISAQRSTQSSPTEKLRSGLEDNTPQLDIELPHKQTPDSLDWPSNLLLSGTEHPHPHPHPRPGCSPSCLRCAPMTALPDIKAWGTHSAVCCSRYSLIHLICPALS